MGVSLHFTSVEPVDLEVEEAIQREWELYRSDRRWVLCEPPHFYPTEPDGRLRGASKLNLHPWADEWETASQIPVERNDLQELLRLLCAWSSQFSLSWELEVEGMPFGWIEEGTPSQDLEAALEAFAEVGQYLAEEFPHISPDESSKEPPTGFGLRIWPEPE